MYRLIYLSGKNKGRRLAIGEAIVTLGSHPDCPVQIEIGQTEPITAALITLNGDIVTIQADSDQFPVYVNGHAQKTQTLHHGDKIDIGHTQFLFQTVDTRVFKDKRRIGPVQMIAGAAVILIILVELFFLVGLTSLKKQGEQAMMTNDLPVTEETENDVLKAAEARLEALNEQDAEIVTETSISNEIDEIRRQLADIKGDMASLEETAPTEEASTNVIAATASQESKEEPVEDNTDSALPPELVGPPMELIGPPSKEMLLVEKKDETIIEEMDIVDQGEQSGPVATDTPATEEQDVEAEPSDEDVDTPEGSVDSEIAATNTIPEVNIRLTDVSLSRKIKTDYTSDMRLLTLTISADTNDVIDLDKLDVMVDFYDKDRETRDIVRSQHTTPQQSLNLTPSPGNDNQWTAEGTYLVLRDAENAKRFKYYGYHIQVFYNDILEDEAMKPARRLKAVIEDQETTTTQPDQ